MYMEEPISHPKAMAPIEAEMDNIAEAIDLFIEGVRTESATIALISQSVARYELSIEPEDREQEGQTLFGFIDPQNEDRMYTSHDLAYLEYLRPNSQIFRKQPSGEVWSEYRTKAGQA